MSTKKEPHFIEIPELKFKPAYGKAFGVELLGKLEYYSEILNSVVTVPEGFLSDGASVPRIFWTRFPPFGKYLEAAIIHDYYYTLGEEKRAPIDYKLATKVFREAMKVCGVNWIRRNVMYQAVMWFGPRFKAVK